MNNKIICGTHKQDKRMIKNGLEKRDLVLQQIFDLTYAGKAHIFIIQKRYKYQVIIQGVHFVEDIFIFAPHYIQRITVSTLYEAILVFNNCINQLTSSMDWYSPELYESNKIFEEITVDNVY